MNIKAPDTLQVPALRSLWQEAFGDSEDFLDVFHQTAFRADRCRCAAIEEEPVAALYWFDCLHMGKPIAYLYAIATANRFQGQGICHKLMADTHHHLAGLGYKGAILVPGSKELFHLYESMGYQTCSYIRTFSCNDTDDTDTTDSIQLRTINAADYASLRPQYLPKHGVLQEGVNLDFLQTQASFYAGTDFLLAARGEKDTLYGMELLGNVTAAPHILCALGYQSGIFRTPGTDQDIPFAMYLPLSDSTLPPPDYFGLAFDI